MSARSAALVFELSDENPSLTQLSCFAAEPPREVIVVTVVRNE